MDIIHKIKDKENGCPYGQHCDRCNFYKPLYRTDDKGKVTQEWDCNLNNLAILLSEQKERTTGLQRAIESFRNEVNKSSKQPLRIAWPANEKRQLQLPEDPL